MHVITFHTSVIYHWNFFFEVLCRGRPGTWHILDVVFLWVNWCLCFNHDQCTNTKGVSHILPLKYDVFLDKIFKILCCIYILKKFFLSICSLNCSENTRAWEQKSLSGDLPCLGLYPLVSVGREGFLMSFAFGQYCGSTEFPSQQMTLKSQQEELGRDTSPRNGRRCRTTDMLWSSAVPGPSALPLSVLGDQPCVESWSLIRLNCTKHFPWGKFPVGTGLPLPFHWAKRLWRAEVRSRRPLDKQPGNAFGKWWWHLVCKMGSPGQAAQRHPMPPTTPTATSSASALVLVLTADWWVWLVFLQPLIQYWSTALLTVLMDTDCVLLFP